MHHCNSEEGQGGAGREDSGYIWEEFRVVPTQREYFVSMQTKYLLAVSISAGLLGFCTWVVWRQYQWLDQPVPAGGKGQEADKVGSSHDCVLTVTLGSLDPNKSPGCNTAQLHGLCPRSPENCYATGKSAAQHHAR